MSARTASYDLRRRAILDDAYAIGTVASARHNGGNPKRRRRGTRALVIGLIIVLALMGAGGGGLYVRQQYAEYQVSLELMELLEGRIVMGGVSNPRVVEVGPSDSTTLIELPDGSTARLRPRSRFAYTRDSSWFMSGALDGEAVLEITGRGFWSIGSSGGSVVLTHGTYAMSSRAARLEDSSELRISIARGLLPVVHPDTIAVHGPGEFVVLTRAPVARPITRTALMAALTRPSAVRVTRDSTGFPKVDR